MRSIYRLEPFYILVTVIFLNKCPVMFRSGKIDKADGFLQGKINEVHYESMRGLKKNANFKLRCDSQAVQFLQNTVKWE